MQSENTFTRESVFPSWWANALGQFVSLLASNLTLTLASSTSVSVPAGADDAGVALAVGGNWRWIESTISRAHPGGAAGRYSIFATAAANDVVSSPNPYTDDTDRAFALAIVAQGSTPTIVPGTVDQYRLIGECEWDGTQITRLRQFVPASVPTSAPPIVSALPADPQDGDEVYLIAHPAHPEIKWHMRYNAENTSAYKWEYLGGAPFDMQKNTPETRGPVVTPGIVFACNAPPVLATTQFATSIAGIYRLRFGAVVQLSGGVAVSVVCAAIRTDTLAGIGNCQGEDTCGDTNEFGNPNAEARATLAASIPISIGFELSNSTSQVIISQKYLSVTPVGLQG